MSQPLAERSNDRVRDVGLAPIMILECGTRQNDEIARLDRHSRRRVRPAVEHRKLRHRSAGTLDVKNLLFPSKIRSINAYAPRFDHVESATLLTGREQYVSRGKGLRHT